MKIFIAPLIALTLTLSPVAFAQEGAAQQQECKNVSAILAVIAEQRDKGVPIADLISLMKEALPEGSRAMVEPLAGIAYSPEGRKSTPEQLKDGLYAICMNPQK